MKKRTIGILLPAILALILAPLVASDTTTTTITFKIPVTVSHSIAYTAPCSSLNFAFIETGTIDGTQNQINVTGSDGSACQTQANYIMRVTNGGNVVIGGLAVNFSAISSGVTVKVSKGTNGWESTCTLVTGAGNYTGAPQTTFCRSWNTTYATTLANVSVSLAVSGTADFWLWSDFNNFNSGLATETNATLTTEAKQ